MATAEPDSLIQNGAIRVLIADDDDDMRLLVRTTLSADERLTVVAEAHDGPSAVDAFAGSNPDVCILDYRMPGLSGLEAAGAILERDPDAKLLLFSAFLTSEVADAAARLGIRCMRKDSFMQLGDEVMLLAGSNHS